MTSCSLSMPAKFNIPSVSSPLQGTETAIGRWTGTTMRSVRMMNSAAHKQALLGKADWKRRSETSKASLRPLSLGKSQ